MIKPLITLSNRCNIVKRASSKGTNYNFLFGRLWRFLKIYLKYSVDSSISLLTTNGLFIGRFQPFHKGHLATVKFALGRVDQLVIVVGSAQKSYEPRNPFTAGERIRMIKESLDADGEADARRILIIPVPDIDVHSLWTHQVDMLVPKYDVVFANDMFTLMLFREQGVKTIEAPLYTRDEMAATEIRKRMIAEENWEDLVPKSVSKVIKEINGIERVKAISQNDMLGHYR
jgi:nicotinamide-nucleotide adenylyltransferase